MLCIFDIFNIMLLLVLCCIGMLLKETRSQAIPCTRERIVDCLLMWLDGDGSGNVTAAEINHYTVYRPCGPDPTHMIGEDVVSACDVNGDGVLSESDYDGDHSCMNVDALRTVICIKCEACEEWNPGGRKK